MKHSPLHSVLISFAVCMLVSCTTGAPKVDIGWIGESVSSPQNDTVINEAGGALPALSAQPSAPQPADTGTGNKSFWSQIQQQPEPHATQPHPTTAPAQPQLATPTAAPRTYTVKQGDTLSSIAARHGVSTSSLISQNGLAANPNALRIGQVLRIPAASAAAKPAMGGTAPVGSSASYRTYTVASGDTLSGIAARHGTTVSAIMSVNGFTPDAANRLRIGQTIKLP